ncbi:MAG: HEAT repeat domain-containing protein [Phycisphaerales bacterium JB063]
MSRKVSTLWRTCLNKLPTIVAAVMFVLLPLCCCGFMFGQYPVQRFILNQRSAKMQSYEQRIASDPDDARAAEGIVRYLGNSDHETRGTALRALGRVESAPLDEIQIIAPYLSHEDHYTRRDAILAVKDRGDEAVTILDEIIACLDDPVGIDVRVFAAQVLSNLGADAARALPALREAATAQENSPFHDEFARSVQQIESTLEDQDREIWP